MPLSLDDVNNRTACNQMAMKDYRRAAADADREARLKASQCRRCFYVSGRIGGAMMTTKPCRSCGVEMHFGSTCTDALCKGCADKLRLCRHCAADLEDKDRRKLETRTAKE